MAHFPLTSWSFSRTHPAANARHLRTHKFSTGGGDGPHPERSLACVLELRRHNETTTTTVVVTPFPYVGRWFGVNFDIPFRLAFLHWQPKKGKPAKPAVMQEFLNYNASRSFFTASVTDCCRKAQNNTKIARFQESSEMLRGTSLQHNI